MGKKLYVGNLSYSTDSSELEQLFGAPGAAQDDNVFKFASDVNADQTTEIDRMNTMLAAQYSGGRTP